MNNSQKTKRTFDEIVKGWCCLHKPKYHDENGCKLCRCKSPYGIEIHKPDKKKSNSVLQLSSDSSTSYLGEKLTLKEKETADMLIEYVVEMDKKLKEALIKELRSKNPYANNDIIQSLERFQGYDFCCDMLEKMLKEERK